MFPHQSWVKWQMTKAEIHLFTYWQRSLACFNWSSLYSPGGIQFFVSHDNIMACSISMISYLSELPWCSNFKESCMNIEALRLQKPQLSWRSWASGPKEGSYLYKTFLRGYLHGKNKNSIKKMIMKSYTMYTCLSYFYVLTESLWCARQGYDR